MLTYLCNKTHWYTKAANQGHAEAAQALKSMKSELIANN